MAIKTESTPRAISSETDFTKVTGPSKTEVTRESAANRVFNTLQSNFAKNELGPNETGDLLGSLSISTPRFDPNAGKENSAVHTALTFINDTGVGRNNLPNYNFKLSTNSSALAEFQTISDAVAGIKYEALLFTVGMGISQGANTIQSGLARDVKAADQEVVANLDAREHAVLGHIFNDAKRYIQAKLEGTQLASSVQARKERLSDLRSPELLSTAA